LALEFLATFTQLTKREQKLSSRSNAYLRRSIDRVMRQLELEQLEY
jgi:hypothetical protein